MRADWEQGRRFGRVEGYDGALAAGQLPVGDALRIRVERRRHVVALLLPAAELIDDRSERLAATRQLVVAEPLEL